jgi:hypothetical protein
MSYLHIENISMIYQSYFKKNKLSIPSEISFHLKQRFKSHLFGSLRLLPTEKGFMT